MAQTFIEQLMVSNPNARYGRKNRWKVIATEYVKANPFQTHHQIRTGLALREGSSAWSSCYAALVDLVKVGKMCRDNTNSNYKYWLIGTPMPVATSTPANTLSAQKATTEPKSVKKYHLIATRTVVEQVLYVVYAESVNDALAKFEEKAVPTEIQSRTMDVELRHVNKV